MYAVGEMVFFKVYIFPKDDFQMPFSKMSIWTLGKDS